MNIVKEYLKMLRSERSKITKQEYRALRKQALSGDVDGAIKGLDNALRNKLREFVKQRKEDKI